MQKAAHCDDFERSDAPPGLLVALGAGLALVVAGLMVGLAFLFPQALADRPKGPIGAPPPASRLQVAPREDLLRVEAAESARLESYGRADGGRAHVPIERAMREVAAEGWGDEAR